MRASIARSIRLAPSRSPFVGDDTAAIDRVIDDFARLGWLHRGHGNLELSAEGRAAHARITGRVAATRQRPRAGITDHEYVQVVAILQRMAANLESQAALPVNP